MIKAIFPGSFDPLTNGHLDLIQRASKLFTHLDVVVVTNTQKQPLFTVDEKIELIQKAVQNYTNVQVVAVADELTVDVMHKLQATVLIRGIRNEQDFSYERDIVAMNAHLAPDIETVLLLAKPEYAFISSSMIKEVAFFGGNLTKLVPENVARALCRKMTAKDI